MNIKVTTGDLKEEYEIIGTVFALDSSTAKMFSTVKPAEAFQGANRQLVNFCRELNGDAVICCQFEYRNATSSGLMGKNQVIEIFAYGTAVKLKSASE